MLSTTEIIVAVAICATVTFACRVAPFVLLRGRERSPLLGFLSNAMPLGVMLVLVAYTVGEMSSSPADWVPAVIGIATTAGLHLWRRSIALSLIGGTAVVVGGGLGVASAGQPEPVHRLPRSSSGVIPADRPRVKPTAWEP